MNEELFCFLTLVMSEGVPFIARHRMASGQIRGRGEFVDDGLECKCGFDVVVGHLEQSQDN